MQCSTRVSRYAILATVIAAGCATSVATAQEAQLKVAVTMKPIHALALQVMEGVAKPTLVVDGTASPHTYALKPSDAKMLNEADVLFRVSETLEPFTAKLVRSLPKSVQVVTLEQAVGVKTLARRTNAAFEKHEHSEKQHADHKHGAAAKSAKVNIDGHIWLNPDNAKAIVTTMVATLSAKRPTQAAVLKANGDKAIARLDLLDQELTKSLKTAAGKPYVVFHDAFQYLEARYGLTPVGSITVDPETPPSGKRLSDLRKKITTLKASCVFAEPSFESKLVQTVIEGTPAKTGVLDAEGLSTPAGADAYEVIMRKLAASLTECLAQAS